MEHHPLLLAAVPRAHLVGISVPVEADAALVELYHQYSPQVVELPTLPDLATLPVRKYLRLALASMFSDGHFKLLQTIHSGKLTQTSIRDPNMREHRFRQMVYGIVNLMSSSVEVHFQRDRRYPSTAAWNYFRKRDQESPLCWTAPLAEYWIGDILILPEMEMTTAENLHAAIGKAVQLVNTRTTQAGPTSGEDAPRTIRACILSLRAITIVDICGDKLTHTPNMPLLNRYNHATVGRRALLETLYTPAPRAFAASIPPLPVEIWQNVYRLAEQHDKCTLAVSCRLFRGIAYDYGPVISEWALRKPCPRGKSLAFVAAADRNMHIIGGSVRYVPVRTEVVYVNDSGRDFRPIYRVVLRWPSGRPLELQIPLVGVSVGVSVCW